MTDPTRVETLISADISFDQPDRLTLGGSG